MLTDKSLDLQDIQIFENVNELNDHLNECRNSGQSIGFVPTMGALHEGHMSLVQQSVNECDITVCSIYVNPTQFNNLNDLEKYPRTIDNDLAMLTVQKCNIVYLPKEEEVYPQGRAVLDYDIGTLASVMEGFYRPGHFQGMITIVKKFFDLVQPNKAYFGEKDFQQLSIIRKMVREYKLNIDIVGCSIIREPHGLAMSSRNERLDDDTRSKCDLIFKSLQKIKLLKKNNSVSQVKQHIIDTINASGFLKIDYFELADSVTLKAITNWKDSNNIRAFIAVYCGEVRLIDNIKID
jgi:pantoate--beta-alanine ligase